MEDASIWIRLGYTVHIPVKLKTEEEPKTVKPVKSHIEPLQEQVRKLVVEELAKMQTHIISYLQEAWQGKVDKMRKEVSEATVPQKHIHIDNKMYLIKEVV